MEDTTGWLKPARRREFCRAVGCVAKHRQTDRDWIAEWCVMTHPAETTALGGPRGPESCCGYESPNLNKRPSRFIAAAERLKSAGVHFVALSLRDRKAGRFSRHDFVHAMLTLPALWACCTINKINWPKETSLKSTEEYGLDNATLRFIECVSRIPTNSREVTCNITHYPQDCSYRSIQAKFVLHLVQHNDAEFTTLPGRLRFSCTCRWRGRLAVIAGCFRRSRAADNLRLLRRNRGRG